MDDKQLIDILTSLGEKIGVLDGRYDKLLDRIKYVDRLSNTIDQKLTSIENKLDDTFVEVTGLKSDIFYIKQEGADIKLRIKTEIDLVWGEMRRMKEETSCSFDEKLSSCISRQEKNLDDNFAKKIYVDNKVSSVKYMVLTASIIVLFGAVAYFLSKAFSKLM